GYRHRHVDRHRDGLRHGRNDGVEGGAHRRPVEETAAGAVGPVDDRAAGAAGVVGRAVVPATEQERAVVGPLEVTRGSRVVGRRGGRRGGGGSGGRRGSLGNGGAGRAVGRGTGRGGDRRGGRGRHGHGGGAGGRGHLGRRLALVHDRRDGRAGEGQDHHRQPGQGLVDQRV